MTEHNPGYFADPWDPSRPLPDEFVELPGAVYAGDPLWLGEDSHALRHLFSAANPWFKTGRAWLGVIPGQVRLAGFINDQLIDGEPAAFFGFWETQDDTAANSALFNDLMEWARSQGARRLYGPINFTTFSHYRLRLDRFEEGAFPGEPWNPAYYPRLLDELGLEIRHRYLSTFSPVEEVLASVKPDYLRVKPKLEQVISLDAMTPDFWMSNLDELYGFVDEVFGGNFAYTPISREAFVRQCGAPFAERFCPQTSILARSREDGRIAGFFLVYPDYSPLLRRGNPHRIAAADLHYATHYSQLNKPRLALAKTGGVHPDFRALGLFTAMSCELSLRCEGHYEQVAATLVRDDNNSRQFALRHGKQEQRSYALYQIAL